MNSDMTKYCYQHFENAYNIGWNVNFDSTVESKETFNSIFIEKLTSYCENPLNSDLNGVCRETEIDGKKYVKRIRQREPVVGGNRRGVLQKYIPEPPGRTKDSK